MSKNYRKIISENRRARYEYHIEDTLEAGICLIGSEVKSLREGKVNITDAFAEDRNGEIWLINSHISEYKGANRFNHEPLRLRKLLLKKKEINKLIGKIRIKGYSIVVLKIYFNDRNRVKLELAIVKGKKLHDKRQAEKDKEWKREKQDLMRD